MVDKRLIEDTFPVKEVSEESAREKSIRHGHISTLHIWWARRPLASSRATTYAALVNTPKRKDELDNKRQFITKLSKWENSQDVGLFERARKDILASNGGIPPKVLDPFAGGGAIPLEAIRLGCETYAIDYNPVATLILKCTIEYPQKYGKIKENSEDELLTSRHNNSLLEDVKKWSTWVLERSRQDIERFYPIETDGSIPVGYIWARTIPCQNLSCGAEIPLMRYFWLARRGGKGVALLPHVTRKEVSFSVVGPGYEKFPADFDPDEGTVSKAVARCLVCGAIVDDDSTRRLSREGKTGNRMLAVILHKKGVSGKRYRIANVDDLKIFNESQDYLVQKRQLLEKKMGFDPVPDEPIHTPDNKEYKPGNLLYNFTPVMLYGMTRWGDLYNSRQKLAMITFVENVRNARNQMANEGIDAEHIKIVATYLALILDRLADKNASLVVYNVYAEKIEHVFGRQALPMVWDYVELNPFTDVGWPNMQEWVEQVIDHCSKLPSSAKVDQASATSLPYPNNFFDGVFTDPPYYDNVPYADLSDFFYVWLKRSIGDLYPDLFSTQLTPKGGEVLAELPLLRGMSKVNASQYVEGIKTKEHFEETLLKSFKEIRRVLKPDGIAVIVYAHKSTAGWETLVNSLLGSGLVVTGAWPLHTEMPGRLRARESAALASSIYMVTRKTERESTGFYMEVKEELKKYLHSKLDILWNEGISGPDFFIAAIGSAIEVFGKYERVIDDEGNTVRADRMLEDVRRIVTDYAIKQVLHNGFSAEINPLTRFYILWRWAYGSAVVSFDDAKKLGQSIGIDVSHEWNRSFIKKEKEFIEVLGPEERDPKSLTGSTEFIDVLHHVLLLWKKGDSESVTKTLNETGYGRSDVFFRVAQAISESLAPGSKEKKLIEGFLSGKERISEEMRKEPIQTRLFE